MEADLGMSEDEALAAIREALGLEEPYDDPQAWTLTQMAEKLNKPLSTIQNRAQRAVQAGTLEEVAVWRRDSAGKMQKMKAYRRPQ